MITKEIINGIWNYYLSLEKDLDSISRYVEPKEQENVYSYEFSKLLILSCTELESVFKILCYERTGKKHGNISEYKTTILKHYPKIVFAEVGINRWGKVIKPFVGWDKSKLMWWDAYVNVKHNRRDNFKEATYQNTVYALSALYVSIFYLAKVAKIEFADYESIYIHSEYASTILTNAPTKEIPDFDSNFTEKKDNSELKRKYSKIYFGKEIPPENLGEDGDIYFLAD